MKRQTIKQDKLSNKLKSMELKRKLTLTKDQANHFEVIIVKYIF